MRISDWSSDVCSSDLGTPTYRELAHLPLEKRVAKMRDPDIRRRILSEDPLAQSTFALLSRLSNERVFRLSNPPDYAPPRDQSVAAIAARQGRRPEEENGRASCRERVCQYV